MKLLNIFHAIAALLFALLLELFAGNFYVVIPFGSCVLNRITAKFTLPFVFLSGFLTGLLLDLIYWRPYPGSALATGFTVLAVRLITDRSKIGNTLLRSLFQGALTGIFGVFLMVLFTGYADSRPFPAVCHIFTSFAGALIFQLLISPRRTQNNLPERALPAGNKTGKNPKSSPRGKNPPRQEGKKKNK